MDLEVEMKGDRLEMSAKERQRKGILEGVYAGCFTLNDAAKRLKISYRQVKRIYKRYREEGDKGLIHRNCGQPCHGAYSAEFRQNVLDLYRTKYFGFGPTFACEKLEKEGFTLSDETLRLWLITEGLWDKQRKRKPYRKKRLRKACFGEMLQLDGSPHPWFGEDYMPCCLMNLVDDATGTTMALLREQETTEGAMTLLKNWIVRYGVPKSIYVDLKTVYVSPKTLKLDESQDEITAAFTHFSKACDKLGIRIIKAYSPQAKGRVERNHGVYQDRFVKELKLQGIYTIDKANRLLDHSFVDELNQKFSKPPQDPFDMHRNADFYGDLNQIFCWEYTRQVQQDWTVRFYNQWYQIEKMKPLIVRPKQIMTIREHLDETVSLWYKGHRLMAHPTATPVKSIYQKKGYNSDLMSKNARNNKHRTPWGQFNPSWLKQNQENINT